jgi:uncharacterized protein (TIGR02147 family)
MNGFYKERLKAELSQRTGRNPRYSLRSFARALRISPSALSIIFSGRRVPSVSLAAQMANALCLPPHERQRFMESVARAHIGERKKYIRKEAKALVSGTVVAPRELSLEYFTVLSDWFHYAILELTFTKDFVSDPAWIARELGISELQARHAIDRLDSLGMLERQEGRLVKTQGHITTADKHLTTPALKRRQAQILDKSLHSLENDPIELRNHSAMTMAIAPEKIPEAKRRIDKFLNELCEFLEDGPRELVYEMQVSLFPLQNYSNHLSQRRDV